MAADFSKCTYCGAPCRAAQNFCDACYKAAERDALRPPSMSAEWCEALSEWEDSENRRNEWLDSLPRA